MNRDEFYTEIINSDVKIEGLPAILNEFRTYQDDTMRTLREFHRICEKCGVRYQLAFGSLLGAIRDGGQIPWDYDIDVIVPFDERVKLIKALDDNLNDDFYFYTPEKDKKCSHYFIRIAPKKYDTSVLHVDVFYIIGAPLSEDDIRNFDNEMKRFFSCRVYKQTKLFAYSGRALIKVFIYKLILKFIPISWVDKKILDICNRYPLKDSKLCIPLFRVYSNIYFEYEKLWDTKLIDTDYGTFRITKNYDEILSRIYGDYMRVYPLENRLSEMLRFYEHISGKKVVWNKKNIRQGRYYIED